MSISLVLPYGRSTTAMLSQKAAHGIVENAMIELSVILFAILSAPATVRTIMSAGVRVCIMGIWVGIWVGIGGQKKIVPHSKKAPPL